MSQAIKAVPHNPKSGAFETLDIPSIRMGEKIAASGSSQQKRSDFARQFVDDVSKRAKETVRKAETLK